MESLHRPSDTILKKNYCTRTLPRSIRAKIKKWIAKLKNMALLANYFEEN